MPIIQNHSFSPFSVVSNSIPLAVNHLFWLQVDSLMASSLISQIYVCDCNEVYQTPTSVLLLRANACVSESDHFSISPSDVSKTY